MDACPGLPPRQFHKVGTASINAEKGRTNVVGQVTGPFTAVYHQVDVYRSLVIAMLD